VNEDRSESAVNEQSDSNTGHTEAIDDEDVQDAIVNDDSVLAEVKLAQKSRESRKLSSVLHLGLTFYQALNGV
jgi:hypothetical protein